MFEKITIHRGVIGNAFDLGQLAETLLFYRSNLLLLDRGSLIAAVNALGQDGLLRLVDEFEVNLSYHREIFATLTNNTNGIKNHNFSEVVIGGTKEKKIKSTHQEIEDVLSRHLGSSRATRKFSEKIIDRTTTKTLKKEECLNLTNAAKFDILDPIYANYAARAAISVLAPTANLNDAGYFKAIDLGKDGFVIDSNFDFDALDHEYRKVPGQEEGSLSDALVATYIFSARAEAYYASTYMAGYVCDPINSALMKRRFFDLVRQHERDIAQIDLFQEHVVPDGIKLREAVNSGEVSFDEVLRLVSKAKRFQDWLSGLNPDASLLSHYIAEIKKEDWLSTLPGKAFRWVTMGGLGTVVGAMLSGGPGAAAGWGLSAIDAFFVDRIFRGWRPDQFVQGPFADLLRR